MLRVYNTLSRRLEEFKPIRDGRVGFYQCGPTVYSHQHIGNMFSVVKGDMIRRSLLYLDYDVNYVRNITDVGHLVSDEDSGEDKMAKGSKKEGLSPEEIASKYTTIFHFDLKKLNNLVPDTETVATEYVIQMADMVQDLLDKGYAYATGLAIYFDVDKFPAYTDLSGQNLEANIDGAGHGVVGDKDKKNKHDFAVWFFKTGSHQNALQTWDYQFKNIEQKEIKGFPGWHIECSAMAKAVLGKTLDMHMGGREHIPVHHTNEIAQSEAANDAKFVNYWLHHEMLLIDGGKMSKSLGNVYFIDDLEEKGFSALDYRYFLLQAHYRSKQNFTWEALGAAKTAYSKLKDRVKELNSKEGTVLEEYDQKVRLALMDDFNIPQALSIVWDLLKAEEKDEDKYATIIEFDQIFGLKLRQSAENKSKLSPAVEALIEERKTARINNEWDKSDKIRDILREEQGVLVEDTSEGQKIKILS